ncbi:flotillin [Serinibacter arcticus]|uniref:Flotillin n=1 Tax=Serinibacter arcticus TaxID=1655435 RepID=A0A2U1ZX18_9MICO|nr:flotillin family protein [Serinibacter arcticus]PWD51521.1 flotillin [Serinibacter arcticus]
MIESVSPALIGVAILVVAVLVIGLLLIKQIKRVPPNQALVIVGRNSKDGTSSGQRVIIGGRAFVIPILEAAFEVSLEQRSIDLRVDAVDANYVPTSVKATVLFKVRGDEEGVRRAAQRFLSQQADIKTPMQQALEGALRPIIGSMTVEELIKDRDTLQEKVVSSIKTDLAEQGFQVDLVNLSDIDTPGSDVLRNLGRAQAARTRQAAEMVEAETRLASENARITADEKVAARERDLALKRAGIKAETDRADAEALASGQLARAEQEALVAARQQTALVEQARVTEEQLDIDVRKPAEAAAFARVQDANAQRDADNAATQAEAFRRKEIAEANKTAAVLDAEATRATGEAEAAAIEARGLAQAAATKAQAEALSEQGQAVLAQQYIERLPEIVTAAAQAYGNVDGLTIISNDGASSISKGITQLIAENQGLLGSAFPNVDFSGLIGGAEAPKSPTGTTTAV